METESGKQTMNSVKKNFIYNIVYQLLVMVIPLITAPYLARVIGSAGVGTYSYTYSIVYYFMMITMLGVNNYGNRSIAKARNEKHQLSKTFWGIYLFQLALGLLMLVLYLGFTFFFEVKYTKIALIQSLFILSAILDINWFYFGLEKFKITITRNAVLKILSVILIFTFVRHSDDLWKYTLIMSGTTVLSQLVLWTVIRKEIDLVKISIQDIVQHIKPNLILFIPVIAVSLYKMMDKIMLGYLVNVTEVGYYENAEKIMNIPQTFIAALGTVMLPRMSSMVSEGNRKEMNSYIEKSIDFIMFLSFGMCFALISVGYHFAPWYFGAEFQKTGILIMMLAVTLPFVSFANVIRTQYLIPVEKDKEYVISVQLGAVVNFVINLMLIPAMASTGACVGTILAEVSVMGYQTFAVRKELDIRCYLKNSIPFLLKSIVMFVVMYAFNYLEMKSIYRLLLQVLAGGMVYLLLNFRYVFTLIKNRK